MFDSLKDSVDDVIWRWIMEQNIEVSDKDEDEDIGLAWQIRGEGTVDGDDGLEEQFYNWYVKKYPEGDLMNDYLRNVPSDKQLESEFIKEIYTPQFIEKGYNKVESQRDEDLRTQAGEMGYHSYEDGTWYGD